MNRRSFFRALLGVPLAVPAIIAAEAKTPAERWAEFAAEVRRLCEQEGPWPPSKTADAIEQAKRLVARHPVGW